MDQIRLMGVECRVKLGVPDWERKQRQKIWLDIILELPLSKAGRSDDVRDTVNYAAVEQEARITAERGTHRLAERLAFLVADAVLRLDKRIKAIRVAVHKRPKVMPKTADVVIEIAKRRG
jgi:dihydroneopterin aldolase